jgi:hypothetical protein
METQYLKHGNYSAEIATDVNWLNWFYIPKVTKIVGFSVTNMFNGDMQLVQGPNGTVRDNGYVSSQTETVHNIVISDKDQMLYQKAAYVRVYWFIDCLYMGVTDSLNFSYWYKQENGKYNVEAVLMLSFEPLPEPTSTTQAPTTTTTTTT